MSYLITATFRLRSSRGISVQRRKTLGIDRLSGRSRDLLRSWMYDGTLKHVPIYVLESIKSNLRYSIQKELTHESLREELNIVWLNIEKIQDDVQNRIVVEHIHNGCLFTIK